MPYPDRGSDHEVGKSRDNVEGLRVEQGSRGGECKDTTTSVSTPCLLAADDMTPHEEGMDLPKIDDLVAIVRDVADAEIMPRFQQTVEETKSDGSVVTEADLQTQRRLLQRLQERYPAIPLLGEEMRHEEQRALLSSSDLLWCLDPLDGTSNFASGVPVFCTSLALLQRAEPLLGLVYDPTRRECFYAARGQGAWLNGRRLDCDAQGRSELSQCVAEVDLKRLPRELAARLAAEHPFRSQRNFGSAALDWAWLADGRYQLYLHGGQKLWDYVAGYVIAQEAGVTMTTLEGERVPSSELIPRSVVAAASPELHGKWLACLRSEPS